MGKVKHSFWKDKFCSVELIGWAKMYRDLFEFSGDVQFAFMADCLLELSCKKHCGEDD